MAVRAGHQARPVAVSCPCGRPCDEKSPEQGAAGVPVRADGTRAVGARTAMACTSALCSLPCCVPKDAHAALTICGSNRGALPSVRHRPRLPFCVCSPGLPIVCPVRRISIVGGRVCGRYGSSDSHRGQAPGISDGIERALLTRPVPTGASALRFLTRSEKGSTRKVARLLGVSRRTVQRWVTKKSGARRPPGPQHVQAIEEAVLARWQPRVQARRRAQAEAEGFVFHTSARTASPPAVRCAS